MPLLVLVDGRFADRIVSYFKFVLIDLMLGNISEWKRIRRSMCQFTLYWYFLLSLSHMIHYLPKFFNANIFVL
jgi:hypothetical protein